MRFHIRLAGRSPCERVKRGVMIKDKKLLIFLIATLMLLGCWAEPYSFFLDSYPPNSAPHEQNWSHLLKIVVNPTGGKYNELCEKNVEISIQAKDKKILLKEDFKLIFHTLDREVNWNNFEKIAIKLFDENLKTKKRTHLLTIIYSYNTESKKFEQSELNKLKS